jgi:hypothetical protein
VRGVSTEGEDEGDAEELRLTGVRRHNARLHDIAFSGLRAATFHRRPDVPDEVDSYRLRVARDEARGDGAWTLWFWRPTIVRWVRLPLSGVRDQREARHLLSWIDEYHMYAQLDVASFELGHYVEVPHGPGGLDDALAALRSATV